MPSTRRGFLTHVAAGATASMAYQSPLNIVYIHSHDSGRYLSPY